MRWRSSLIVTGATLVALVSGCAGQVGGSGSFGEAGSKKPPAIGLAAESPKEIFAAVKSFASRQKSVHLKLVTDGKTFTDADISYTTASGTTTYKDRLFEFRITGSKMFARSPKGGDWSPVGSESDFGKALHDHADFQTLVQELYVLERDAKKVEPKLLDEVEVIALTDERGGEVVVANDADAAAPLRFTGHSGDHTSVITLSRWSESGLQVSAPETS